MKILINHIINTQLIFSTPALSLMSWIYQVRRRCLLQHLRGLWEDNQDLRQIARERHWDVVLGTFNVEHNYRVIKLKVRAGQRKGIL